MSKNQTQKTNMSQKDFIRLLETVQTVELTLANGNPLTASQETVFKKAIDRCLDLLNPTEQIKF